MNALASPEVGKYINEHFVASFQKVATFRIVGGLEKQGGNVASYFCTPDGCVLHVVAGPVDAATLLREVVWVIETTQKSKNLTDARRVAFFRNAHAKRLQREHGLVVEPVPFVSNEQKEEKSFSACTVYPDRPLPPRPTLPPIAEADACFEFRQEAVHGQRRDEVVDKDGRRWPIDRQGRVHQLMAGHACTEIEKVYGTIFEGILDEPISPKPVEKVRAFVHTR